MKYFLIIVAALIVNAASRPIDDTREVSVIKQNVRTDGDSDLENFIKDNSVNDSNQPQLPSDNADQTSSEPTTNEANQDLIKFHRRNLCRRQYHPNKNGYTRMAKIHHKPLKS